MKRQTPELKRKPDWNGHAPQNDHEAETLIINAAIRVAERDGIKKTNIKKVADELGITRQTIYRLFPSSEELLKQVSITSGGKNIDQLLKIASKQDYFENRVIESIIFLVRQIPQDEFLKKFFMPMQDETLSAGVLVTRESLNYSVEILKAINAGSKTPTPDEEWLLELAEHMRRIIISLIMAPTRNTQSAQGMRNYLNQWLKPLLRPVPTTA